MKKPFFIVGLILICLSVYLYWQSRSVIALATLATTGVTLIIQSFTKEPVDAAEANIRTRKAKIILWFFAGMVVLTYVGLMFAFAGFTYVVIGHYILFFALVGYSAYRYFTVK